MRASIPLLLFAKAPIAGKVKTRLTSHCNDQQAAEIAKILMQASIEKAVRAWPGQVYLSVWLDYEHPFFIEMLARYPIKMSQQREGDLGEKMRSALAEVGYPSAVMGCDAPQVKASSLGQAYRLLAAGQSVIGPADDGGYYFLGLVNDSDTLFFDMPWGTDKVLDQTLRAADVSSLNLQQLAALNDVDEWGDLLSVADSQPQLLAYLKTNNLI